MADKYINAYLKAIKEAGTDQERVDILEKLYQDGFEDGHDSARSKEEDKIMETLRLKVRDAIQSYFERPEKVTVDDVADVTCDLADLVFEALGISEAEQDIEGAEVAVNGLKKEDVPVNEIQNIVNYLYEDESKDYESVKEEGGKEKHIFNSVEEVDNWLTYIQTGNHKVL